MAKFSFKPEWWKKTDEFIDTKLAKPIQRKVAFFERTIVRDTILLGLGGSLVVGASEAADAIGQFTLKLITESIDNPLVLGELPGFLKEWWGKRARYRKSLQL